MCFFVQFLVIGVSVGSKGYEMLKNGRLRLLDILTQVNGQPISKLPVPISDALKRLSSGTMVADCSIAIRCISFMPIINEGECGEFFHDAVVLMYLCTCTPQLKGVVVELLISYH